MTKCYDVHEPDGFLVLLRCTMDDLPLRFFNDRADALLFAGNFAVEDRSLPPAEMKDFYDIGGTEVVCIDVYQFEDGKPSKRVGRMNLQ